MSRPPFYPQHVEEPPQNNQPTWEDIISVLLSASEKHQNNLQSGGSFGNERFGQHIPSQNQRYSDEQLYQLARGSGFTGSPTRMLQNDVDEKLARYKENSRPIDQSYVDRLRQIVREPNTDEPPFHVSKFPRLPQPGGPNSGPNNPNMVVPPSPQGGPNTPDRIIPPSPPRDERQGGGFPSRGQVSMPDEQLRVLKILKEMWDR